MKERKHQKEMISYLSKNRCGRNIRIQRKKQENGVERKYNVDRTIQEYKKEKIETNINRIQKEMQNIKYKKTKSKATEKITPLQHKFKKTPQQLGAASSF